MEPIFISQIHNDFFLSRQSSCPSETSLASLSFWVGKSPLVQLWVCPLTVEWGVNIPYFVSFLRRCLGWRVLSLAACVFFSCVVQFLFSFSGLSSLISWHLNGLRLTSVCEARAHIFFQFICCVPWFWMRLQPQFGGWSPRFFLSALPYFGLDLLVRSLLFLPLLLPSDGLHVASLDRGCGSRLIPEVVSLLLQTTLPQRCWICVLVLSSSVLGTADGWRFFFDGLWRYFSLCLIRFLFSNFSFQ